jgi:hypothetical protein
VANSLFRQSAEEDTDDYAEPSQDRMRLGDRGPLDYTKIVHRNFRAGKPYFSSYRKKRTQLTSVAQ